MRASQRLTDSAACLVAGGFGPDRELERLLARHNRGAGTKPILELNMRHGLVKALARAKTEARDTDVVDLAEVLFDQACILDGEVPENPGSIHRTAQSPDHARVSALTIMSGPRGRGPVGS